MIASSGFFHLQSDAVLSVNVTSNLYAGYINVLHYESFTSFDLPIAKEEY
jgi:hypothetical protein